MFTPPKSDLTDILSRLSPELNSLSGRKIFLAGAAGFLGRYLIHVFSEFNKRMNSQIEVIGVDNLVSSGDFGRNMLESGLEGVNFINADVSRLSRHELKYAQDSELVIHGAGIASPQQYKAQPLKTIDVAVNGTRSLLGCCNDVDQRFVFFSSSEIYGNPPADEIPISEDFKGIVSSTGPRSCYDESKRLGETLCSVFSDQYGVHTNIIRPFNIYGPGMQKTDYRVMPNFAFRIKDNLPIQVYGTGNQTRTYCYITDAIVGFIKVFVNGQYCKPYNIGNPNNETSALRLAEIFREVCNSEVPIEVQDHPSEYPSDEPDRRCPNIERAKLDLNYEPHVDLETGIRKFYEYIK